MVRVDSSLRQYKLLSPANEKGNNGVHFESSNRLIAAACRGTILFSFENVFSIAPTPISCQAVRHASSSPATTSLCSQNFNVAGCYIGTPQSSLASIAIIFCKFFFKTILKYLFFSMSVWCKVMSLSTASTGLPEIHLAS